MKKKFLPAEIELINIAETDVIATSSGENPTLPPDEGENDSPWDV